MKVRKVIQMIFICTLLLSLCVYYFDAYPQYLENVFKKESLLAFSLCQVGFLSSYFAFCLYDQRVTNNISYTIFAMVVVIFVNLLFLSIKSKYEPLSILTILVFLVLLIIEGRIKSKGRQKA